MKTINKLSLAALATLVTTLLFITQFARADSPNAKVDYYQKNITFEKCFVADDGPFGGHFEGSVTGDCGAGSVYFTYISVIPGTRVVRFSGEYLITTPKCTINAVCGGTLDTRTGRIALNGVVTEGSLLGNRVQLRAQLNQTGNCSSGRITITPQ